MQLLNCRFLDHLQLKTQISFVELDMSELLSKETIKYYKGQFLKREKIRLANKQKDQELDKLKPQKYSEIG